MADFSWFSDEQWSWIEPLLPIVWLSACYTQHMRPYLRRDFYTEFRNSYLLQSKRSGVR
jgi:hypothetical protein